ncbi:MAG: hypothetical protein JNL72_10515 [Flavipsychrobacter sp.]|nr:hypothetical protein [Flavipsychrobacter sp.]
MSNSLIDNGSKGSTPPYKTAGRWFAFLVIFLFVWAGLYIYTHQSRVFNGYQSRQFSRSNIEKLNRILYESALPVAPAPQVVDTTALPPDMDSFRQATQPQPRTEMSQVCDDSCRINKALLYVRTEFDNKVRKEDEAVIASYIRTYSGREVAGLLEDLDIKVDSYFWLSGPYMYLEMIFWVLFGVICSNLFALGVIARSRGWGAFSAKEVPYQAAKFFYAPVFTIILILAFNYFRHSEVSDVNATQGTIVFSFVAGLFSGGLMSFLERLKSALFPEHPVAAAEIPAATRTKPPEPEYHAVVAKTPTQPSPAHQEQMPVGEPSPAVINDLYKETTEGGPGSDVKTKEEELEALSSTMALTAEEEETPPAASLQPDTPTGDVVPQVVVVLNLDVSGLYEEEKNEIIDIGFANAVVTMHNVNGREIITARKSDDKYTASFVAPDVKPGIYIVRCTLTQKLSDDYTINLFGEKTVYLTHENTSLELFIKKYEAID